MRPLNEFFLSQVGGEAAEDDGLGAQQGPGGPRQQGPQQALLQATFSQARSGLARSRELFKGEGAIGGTKNVCD